MDLMILVFPLIICAIVNAAYLPTTIQVWRHPNQFIAKRKEAWKDFPGALRTMDPKLTILTARIFYTIFILGSYALVLISLYEVLRHPGVS